MCVVKGVLLTSNKKAQEGGGERVEGTKAGTGWWWGGVSLSTSEKGARRTRKGREEYRGERERRGGGAGGVFAVSPSRRSELP